MEPLSNSFQRCSLCLFILVSFCLTSGAQGPLPISSSYNDPTQQIVEIEFDQIITVAPDNAGWTINVNASPVPILGPPLGVGTSILAFHIAAPIVFGNVVTVSYDDLVGSAAGLSGDVATFNDFLSQNTNIPDCSMFTGVYSINVNGISGPCYPVVADITASYEIATPYRNSINFNPADLRFRISWGDDALSGGGFYLVCLTVQNEFGISNITCKYIQVAAESINNCLADYYFSIDSAGTNVSFVDASFGKPDEWAWGFGDEMTSDLEEPVHLNSETGVYRVGLHIRNSLTGCVSKVYKLVDAGADNTGLYASFIYEFDSTNLKADSYPVDFIGISLGDSKKLNWDFGDDDTDSTSTQTRHIYTKQDIFDACFTVSNPVTGEENISCDQISTISSNIRKVISNAYSLVAYPNPFNDKLIIDYYMPAEEYVDISIYDFTGRKIATLIDLIKLPGNHTAEFDQDQLPADCII